MSETSETLNMSVSLITGKKGKKQVFVIFSDGKRQAEISYPKLEVLSNNGFEEKEIAALKFYMKRNKALIISKAKGISLLDAL